jgi:hypothetical protein
MINDYLILTVSSYWVRSYGLGIGGEGLGIGEGNQRLKCKMQNCGGPSGGLLFVAG